MVQLNCKNYPNIKFLLDKNYKLLCERALFTQQKNLNKINDTILKKIPEYNENYKLIDTVDATLSPRIFEFCKSIHGSF